MQSDKIYHYTSVDSLALILRYKTLRFTRLDCVDDINESQEHSGIEFGKYLFVSCWTQEEEDNLAQWKMYGNDMGGVRIELPAYPFKRVRMNSAPFIAFAREEYGPLSTQDLIGPTYIIVPSFDGEFAGKVEYVDDVKSRYDSAIKRSDDGGKVTISVARSMYNLARLKSRVWQFQAEYRFILNVMPLMPSTMPREAGTLAPDQMEMFGKGFLMNRDPGVTYIDVPIDPSVLEKMVVTTGPLCTPGAKICVDALVETYAPKAVVKASPLTGTLRKK